LRGLRICKPPQAPALVHHRRVGPADVDVVRTTEVTALFVTEKFIAAASDARLTAVEFHEAEVLPEAAEVNEDEIRNRKALELGIKRDKRFKYIVRDRAVWRAPQQGQPGQVPNGCANRSSSSRRLATNSAPNGSTPATGSFSS
jgi:hypothetical protein